MVDLIEMIRTMPTATAMEVLLNMLSNTLFCKGGGIGDHSLIPNYTSYHPILDRGRKGKGTRNKSSRKICELLMSN